LDEFIAGKEFCFELILKDISIASTKLTMCRSVQQLGKHRNKSMFGTKCNKLEQRLARAYRLGVALNCTIYVVVRKYYKAFIKLEKKLF